MKKTVSILLFIILISMSCSKDSTDDNVTTGGNNNGSSNNVTANQQPTGTSANDLLSNNTFTSMVIEVVYVDGVAPTQSTINSFVSFLESRTVKPDGITVETRSITSPGNGPYTIQEIINIEDTNRTKYNSNDEIAVWAFFADSESANNPNGGIVLGTAYRNTSFVIYEETIHDLSNSPLEPNRSVLETTVITHEFGHILGLTNLGSDMQNRS